ncbi:MAG: TonB-dependent receptor [endosymbiont of Escarpia spicata]|uniref:TonB-dependent receptor n=1 Tax=endosymbiont of Escarpia spicata TaxID=2200908 RepID=A0A370DJL5_9GAMM|nr:MAG: TonB-dependent receptor [endosymbiont of Escarpia spicata]
MFHGERQLLLSSLLSAVLLSAPISAEESLESYLELDLEDLLSMEVTSVSKKKQRLNEVAAAVFVISQEDIRRSGVTSIPEALRLAPGIQVGRIDANKWAVSSRGFTGQFSNKLLVMIDGRSVYSPTFSGVYWDVQDTLLEDIDRIEVIRGPGAAVWGANAVNGVINIITRHAGETQGGLLVAGAGNEERSFASLRYGAEVASDTHARFYLKYNDRDQSYASDLYGDAGDDWQSLRGGFRVDGQLTEVDSWSLQGDLYDADENQKVNFWMDPSDPANAVFAPTFLAANRPDKVDSSGWNLLGKWSHQLSEQASTALQLYYDHTERSEGFLNQRHDTLDLDFQHQFRAFGGHDIIWGLGYRHVEEAFDNTYMVAIHPNSLNLYSAFVQDEIELLPQTLRLTLGSKFEHNDFTGYEVQPNARLAWLPDDRSTLWGSVSRAVRTPSSVEYDSLNIAFIVPLPPPFPPAEIHAIGNEAFESEVLLAYETGYRIQPRENLSFDLALFYNDYDNIQNFQSLDPLNPLADLQYDNNISAHSYGMELAVDWRALEWWRLQSNYSFIEVSDFTGGILGSGGSPKYQLSLRSMMDLSNNVSLDLWAYYVDELKSPASTVDIPVGEYTSLNARLAWRPQKNLELSLVGQNLLDNHHPEFTGEYLLIQTEVERSAYGLVRVNF